MKCLNCDSLKTRVLDSRVSRIGIRVRRRECASCGMKFSTEERAVSTLLTVVKTDQTRERFDVDKLRKGIELALHKRPVSSATVDQMINKVLKVFGNKGEEIKSSEIGELVMQYLGDIDRVAFIRFASVYRNFTDVQQFGDYAAMPASSAGKDLDSGGKQRTLKYFFLEDET